MSSRNYLSIGMLLLFVFSFQVFSSLTGQEYFLTQLTMSAYYVLVIIGLCVLMGYTGLISLGHAAFFSIGGYTSAVLTTLNLLDYPQSSLAQNLINSGLTVSRLDTYGREIVHISPWAALITAVVITVCISFLVGIPILKLKGHYLAMATLGFGVIVYRIVLGTKIFGEADGISEVPGFDLFLNLRISGDMSDRVMNYYIAWVIVIAGLVILLNTVHSRVGRALRAIHGSEEAANTMGINTGRYKLVIFVLSAVFAAVGGVFMTHYNGGIGPSEAGVMKSVRYVAIVAVGGMANLWGALIMGMVLNYISLRGYLGSYDDAFFGFILVAIMIFAPDGIIRRERILPVLSMLKRMVLKNESSGSE